jgi:copper homeostasis protein
MMHVPLEVCIECSDPAKTARSIRAALAGGASRVELCAEMSRDGLTPAFEYCRLARRLFGENKGVLAMIRPVDGGFVYGPDTIGRMEEEIDAAAEAGADGVVFGALDQTGKVDPEALARLYAAAKRRGLTTTYHRAFDALLDPFGSISILVEQGLDRVLTSGTRWGSGRGITEGIEQVRRIVEAAAGQIEVVIAGGISPSTVEVVRPVRGRTGISVHAYSGVLREGEVDATKVRTIVEQLVLREG